MSAQPPSQGPAPGDIFAGHRIETEIGRGALGTVFRARHLALDRDAALKIMSPAVSRSDAHRKRLRREAAAAARVHHPGVAGVHNAGFENERLYLAMELVDGPDLGDVIAHEGALEADLVSELITEIAEALDAAHEREVLHRDLKPSNVLLARDGRARIVDFGVSRVLAPEAALDPRLPTVGDPDYLAPELIGGGEATKAADVYALGALAHFLLTAEDPFPNRSPAAKLVAAAAVARPAPSAVYADLSPAIDAAIATAMAVDPAERHASAGAFAAELADAVGAVEAEPEPEPAAEADVAETPASEPPPSAPAEDGTEVRPAAAPSQSDAPIPSPIQPAETQPTGLEGPLKVAGLIVIVLVIVLALIFLLL